MSKIFMIKQKKLSVPNPSVKPLLLRNIDGWQQKVLYSLIPIGLVCGYSEEKERTEKEMAGQVSSETWSNWHHLAWTFPRKAREARGGRSL